jgi:hypothetical protein
MESQSAQLEREGEDTRWQLSGTLDELRGPRGVGRCPSPASGRGSFDPTMTSSVFRQFMQSRY